MQAPPRRASAGVLRPLAHNSVPPLLEGWTLTSCEDASLLVRVCTEHLVLLGASLDPQSAASIGELTLRPSANGGADSAGREVNCSISWQGPGPRKREVEDSEATIQALSGLMEVHGRDGGSPRRLGLEVCSIAAGIVATQGVLAALIGQSRGLKVVQVETSVLQAAWLLLNHQIAIATSGGEFPFRPTPTGPGPPFRSADGHLVELEALTGDAWFAFWGRLRVSPGESGPAWLPFVYRYLAGRCSLPAALHEATGRHTLAELYRIAGESGMAICRVRSYPELLAEPGWSGDLGVDRRRQMGTPWTITPGAKADGQSSHASDAVYPGGAPLAGLRVVEVTSRLQGPLAGLLLRALGADVIKVEPPGGDFGRFSPPLAGEIGAAYLAYNRGKRVVEIDYKQPEGQAQLAALVAGADIFLHNWPSGRAERLGLDYERLAPGNPGLVYGHASGWGRVAQEPAPIAGDYLVQAHAACGDGLNPSDEPASPSRLTFVDVTGGLLACEGVLAGLYLRELTGQGCRVDTSLMAAALAIQWDVLSAMAARQERNRRLGRPLWGTLDRPFKTAEGFLVVSVKDNRALQRLAQVCGLDASKNGVALEALVVARLRTRPAAEWEPLLRQAGISAATVRSDLASLPDDPRTTDLLERVNDACWVPAAPWQLKT